MMRVLTEVVTGDAPADLYGLLALLITQVGAVVTLYVQGRTQHAANEERLDALERGLADVRRAVEEGSRA
jgi:hypothetical protein